MLEPWPPPAGPLDQVILGRGRLLLVSSTVRIRAILAPPARDLNLSHLARVAIAHAERHDRVLAPVEQLMQTLQRLAEEREAVDLADAVPDLDSAHTLRRAPVHNAFHEEVSLPVTLERDPHASQRGCTVGEGVEGEWRRAAEHFDSHTPPVWLALTKEEFDDASELAVEERDDMRVGHPRHLRAVDFEHGVSNLDAASFRRSTDPPSHRDSLDPVSAGRFFPQPNADSRELRCWRSV
mmetsp:Transcript_58690/g.137936  ORF Transcript_58690/g.137936 Transcript_58690/m.137936 type:complete len:238 (+) Transcript_58690:131-844(+)